MRFAPATQVGGGEQGETEEHDAQELQELGVWNVGVQPVSDGPDDDGQNHQWMQPNQPYFDELPKAHALPAVIVGIADHEAGQQEKEINRQVPVTHGVAGQRWVITLEQMEDDHEDGRRATQAV